MPPLQGRADPTLRPSCWPAALHTGGLVPLNEGRPGVTHPSRLIAVTSSGSQGAGEASPRAEQSRPARTRAASLRGTARGAPGTGAAPSLCRLCGARESPKGDGGGAGVGPSLRDFLPPEDPSPNTDRHVGHWGFVNSGDTHSVGHTLSRPGLQNCSVCGSKTP